MPVIVPTTDYNLHHRALQEASRALTELDPLGDKHDAKLIDEALAAPHLARGHVEHVHRVFEDIKKRLAYDKSHGTWSWVDRDEYDNLDAYHTGFATALAAMEDAVEVYLNEED